MRTLPVLLPALTDTPAYYTDDNLTTAKKKTDTWLWKIALLENKCPEFCKRLQITLEHIAQIFWVNNITFS